MLISDKYGEKQKISWAPHNHRGARRRKTWQENILSGGWQVEEEYGVSTIPPKYGATLGLIAVYSKNEF